MERTNGAVSRSGSDSLRARQREAVRTEIRGAALRLFEARGFAATTVDEIARQAGVSRSTFFRHFGSKEAVLEGSADESALIFLSCLAERPATECRMEALENALVCMTEEMRTDQRREEMLTMQRIVEADRTLSAAQDASTARWRHEVAGGLAQREGRDAPDLEDELAAAMLSQIAEHASEQWSSEDFDRPVADLIRGYFDAFRNLAR